MQMHGSCAARQGEGVLLSGPPGSGKSDLVLRLLAHGFALVADDRVDIVDGIARPPLSLAGLLEIRGLGILRLPHQPQARLRLLVRLGEEGDRLPLPRIDPELGLPLIALDATRASAADKIAFALDCATGQVSQLAGALAS